ncbi:hypothetical protein ACO1M3_14295, partial [Staphylococcus aureus]
ILTQDKSCKQLSEQCLSILSNSANPITFHNKLLSFDKNCWKRKLLTLSSQQMNIPKTMHSLHWLELPNQ